MDFFLRNNIMHFKKRQCEPTAVICSEALFNLYSFRSEMVTYLFFINESEARAVLLFGSKRIRESYNSRTRYMISSFFKPLLLNDAEFKITKGNLDQYVHTITPFLIELQFNK